MPAAEEQIRQIIADNNLKTAVYRMWNAAFGID